MIAVTGATGQLGRLVIDELIQKGTNPKTIVAVARDESKAVDLISKGVEVRFGDYDSSELLEKAFVGAKKILLISGSEVGKRISQHTNAINAAKKANVKAIVYTSILNADTSKIQLAVEHLATEKVIHASGLPFVILRNGWYIENYTGQLNGTIERGAIAGCAKDGKISAATRADYASAAAAVLMEDKKSNATYELGGQGFTMTELAQVISKISGKKVEYVDMLETAYEQMLVSVGAPAPMAQLLADADLGALRGDLVTKSQDLQKLIGRPVTTIENAVRTAIKQL